MRRSAGDLLALVLLGLAVAALVLTLVELLMRGAPWSESGYHQGKAASALVAGGGRGRPAPVGQAQAAG
jgi:hypothetical protein